MFLSNLYGKLSIILVRSNARAIMRSLMPATGGLSESISFCQSSVNPYHLTDTINHSKVLLRYVCVNVKVVSVGVRCLKMCGVYRCDIYV